MCLDIRYNLVLRDLSQRRDEFRIFKSVDTHNLVGWNNRSYGFRWDQN